MINESVKVEVIAAVAIKRDGKYLLVQEKQERAYGLWNFPAGRVDVGETIEEAAIREAKEESGYDVRLISKVDIFQVNSTDVVKHAFEGEIIGGDLNFPEDEILSAGWFTCGEVSEMKDKLRGSWIYETIEKLEMR